MKKKPDNNTAMLHEQISKPNFTIGVFWHTISIFYVCVSIWMKWIQWRSLSLFFLLSTVRITQCWHYIVHDMFVILVTKNILVHRIIKNSLLQTTRQNIRFRCRQSRRKQKGSDTILVSQMSKDSGGSDVNLVIINSVLRICFCSQINVTLKLRFSIHALHEYSVISWTLLQPKVWRSLEKNPSIVSHVMMIWCNHTK